MASLQRQSTNPNSISSRNWWATAFPNHPYGRPVSGTLESVARITADDMRDYARRVLARDTSQARRRRRHRRRDRRPACRSDLREAAGQGAAQAGPRYDQDSGTGRPDRGRSERAAGGGDVRRPGHCPQRSRLHGGLHRQPHPRRRLVLVAPLSRGARDARPRLRRQHQPDVVRARRRAGRRHRDTRRCHRGDDRA